MDEGPSIDNAALPINILTNTSGTDGGGFSWPEDLYLRDESWAVPLVAAAATNIAAILSFEVYIIVRAIHGTPSRRHLFLGQCLLLGLVLTSLAGIPFALQPTKYACASSRVLVGASSSVVFGALLVKCVFLISLNSGVYLPAHYQGLLLFFIVLVQGVISIQWLSTYPAEIRFMGVTLENENLLECRSSYKNHVMSLVYIMGLIITVAAFAIKCRGIRENYRESTHIGACMCIILPMWLTWTLTGFILPQRLQPACLGFGSVITGTVTFLVMFIPKGRQMAAFGKDGFYKEDREDQLSSISGGRYSPSFFLFQPTKSSKYQSRSSYTNNNSIYKTNLSDNNGFGIASKSVPILPQYVHKPQAQQTQRQPFHHYALPKYAAPHPYLYKNNMWSLYRYYQHYYPVRSVQPLY